MTIKELKEMLEKLDENKRIYLNIDSNNVHELDADFEEFNVNKGGYLEKAYIMNGARW